MPTTYFESNGAARAHLLHSLLLTVLLATSSTSCGEEERGEAEHEERHAMVNLGGACDDEHADVSSGQPCDEPADEREPDDGALTDSEEATMIVLQDVRCTLPGCQIDSTVTALQKAFPTMHVIRHDWSSAECRDLFEQEGLEYLPVLLFDASIMKNKHYVALWIYLQPTSKGQMKQIEFNSDFDPRGEVCTNQVDDTGNNLVDCADPTCRNKPICREEIPGRLDLFIMSQCPYGTAALDAMAEVLDAFERKVDFRIHYIVSEKDGQLVSLHGKPELDEDIRQLCAMAHYPEHFKYMDYIWCRNKNIKDGNFRDCTDSVGIDARVLEECAAGDEGLALLKKDLAQTRDLGFKASPTWMTNNRFVFHGAAPELIKRNHCRYNKIAGCDKKLSTETKKTGVCKGKEKKKEPKQD